MFSFGVVAYKLVMGRAPHVEAPLLLRLAGRRIPSIPPVASQRSDISLELARALEACLAAEPSKRPSVSELRALIEGELAAVEAAAESAPVAADA